MKRDAIIATSLNIFLGIAHYLIVVKMRETQTLAPWGRVGVNLRVPKSVYSKHRVRAEH